eukprot:scaffold6010_cov121-Isochrysis_galbana.AAC.4
MSVIPILVALVEQVSVPPRQHRIGEVRQMVIRYKEFFARRDSDALQHAHARCIPNHRVVEALDRTVRAPSSVVGSPSSTQMGGAKGRLLCTMWCKPLISQKHGPVCWHAARQLGSLGPSRRMRLEAAKEEAGDFGCLQFTPREKSGSGARSDAAVASPSPLPTYEKRKLYGWGRGSNLAQTMLTADATMDGWPLPTAEAC